MLLRRQLSLVSFLFRCFDTARRFAIGKASRHKLADRKLRRVANELATFQFACQTIAACKYGQWAERLQVRSLRGEQCSSTLRLIAERSGGSRFKFVESTRQK